MAAITFKKVDRLVDIPGTPVVGALYFAVKEPLGLCIAGDIDGQGLKSISPANIANILSQANSYTDSSINDVKAELLESIVSQGAGFFHLKQLSAYLDLVAYGEEGGIDPLTVAADANDLPSGVADLAVAIVLYDGGHVVVHQYHNGEWTMMGTHPISNGDLFHLTSDGSGRYWFANTWNQLDAEVDLSQFYTKEEIDNLLSTNSALEWEDLTV
jgi:hypothetical protein